MRKLKNLIYLYKVAICVLINVGVSEYSTSKTRLKSAPKPYHAVRGRLQDQFYFVFCFRSFRAPSYKPPKLNLLAHQVYNNHFKVKILNECSVKSSNPLFWYNFIFEFIQRYCCVLLGKFFLAFVTI